MPWYLVITGVLLTAYWLDDVGRVPVERFARTGVAQEHMTDITPHSTSDCQRRGVLCRAQVVSSLRHVTQNRCKICHLQREGDFTSSAIERAALTLIQQNANSLR